MAKLPGAYELMATAASPAINFTRGLLGYQDPFLTQTMQDRMTELEAEKGPTGSIGYEDYGLPVSTPGGRFTGGLFDLLINNPVDFGLAGSVGRYGFSPEGRTDLEYNFTPDQDTGSTGSAVLDFINKGGIKGLFDSSAIANEPMDIEDFSKKITPMAKPDVVDVNRIPGRIQEAVEPQYRIRDQLNRDFLQGGLFRDAKQGLGQTKNEFLEDISGLTKGLGSIRDTGMNLFGLAKDKTIDLGGMIKRGIGNAIFPGLGFLIGNVKESPTDKFNLQIGKEIGDPYGYKGQLTSGTLGARQDPFGRNLVSMFSDYEKNRMAEVAKLSALENLNKFQQAQLDFGKDYLDKLEAKRQEAINKSFESKSSGGGGGNKGADFTGGRFDRAGSRAAYDANPTGFSGSS